MKWGPVCNTLIQTEDGWYQISRSPQPVGGQYTYRAWFRPDNVILATVTVYDEPAERGAAQAECKRACEEHAGEAGGLAGAVLSSGPSDGGPTR